MKYLSIIGILFIFACSNTKNTQHGQEDQKSQELFTQDTISLSFERTVCFGTCPAYKIVVRNNGLCLYEGYDYVEKVGKYEASITKLQMDEILKEAEFIGYFELKNEYDAPITDVPSVIIMIVGENGRKQVVDRAEAPEQLKRFEKYLDSVLLNLDWKKVD